LLLAALIGGSLSFSALGQSITDGDSLEINGTRWRLHAIDAPELYQTCPDGWPAGAEAAAYLRSLIAGRTLTCEPRGTDRYGRTIGLCRADGRDVETDMVVAGMAWAKYGPDYLPQEERARTLRLGVHLHGCQPAWLWRREKKR
jgi:endonuclease YncB( thermonuclease family)